MRNDHGSLCRSPLRSPEPHGDLSEAERDAFRQEPAFGRGMARSWAGANRKANYLARVPSHILHSLAENDEDVKTVQSLMRHANSSITMNIYTHAVTSKKRRAQQKVVEMILPEGRSTAVKEGGA